MTHAHAGGNTETPTHRHTHTQTHRHRHTQTHRQTHIHTHTQTHIHTYTQTHRHTDTQTQRHTDAHTHRHGHTHTHTHTHTFAWILSVAHALVGGGGRCHTRDRVGQGEEGEQHLIHEIGVRETPPHEYAWEAGGKLRVMVTLGCCTFV